MLLNTVAKFMDQEVAPLASKMDKEQEIDREVIRKCADLGLFSLIIPHEYGGVGLDLTTYCLVIEEISKVDASIGVTVQCSGTGLRPVILAGEHQLKKRVFSETIQNGLVWAFAITEPEAGSDTASIRSRAVRVKDKYILNGRKCFVTNGNLADYYCIFAMTEPQLKSRGMSAFVVPPGSPGLSVGKKEDKMGMRASPTTDLIMEDLEVPAKNIVGAENEAFPILMRTLDGTRPTIGAQALGIAEGALSYALTYANQRQQFGQPISHFQGIQFMLSEMATKVESARALLYMTTALYDQDFPEVSPFSAMSKLWATDVAMSVTTDAVQVMGGYGYMKDHPVERMMRDAKLTQIYEGSNQIQRVVISKWLQKKGYPLL
ncbi:MAG: acyl-CoA dehydrogenase family protein [Deltaproteobacteria bacterium]|nr:acyl-CoA dehydrogenase family protein [Deltaproteobacteria bacterium]